MSKTKEMLQQAFAGESQANRRYLAFAKKAEEEGLHQIARMFRAAAEAETVHAHNHLAAMKGIGDTAANVQAAIEGETYEFESMYPEMIEMAKKEGESEAQRSFYYANEVEKIHAELFKAALEYAREGKDAPASEVYVCPVCGYTTEGEAPEKCPICATPGAEFKRID